MIGKDKVLVVAAVALSGAVAALAHQVYRSGIMQGRIQALEREADSLRVEAEALAGWVTETSDRLARADSALDAQRERSRTRRDSLQKEVALARGRYTQVMDSLEVTAPSETLLAVRNATAPLLALNEALSAKTEALLDELVETQRLLDRYRAGRSEALDALAAERALRKSLEAQLEALSPQAPGLKTRLLVGAVSALAGALTWEVVR